MSSSKKNARSHVNFTNRETPRAAARSTGGERRIVFKSVLHNPLQVQWPTLPLSTQNNMLTAACAFLKSIGPYYVDRRKASTDVQRRSRKERLKRVASGHSVEASGEAPKTLKRKRIVDESEAEQKQGRRKKSKTALEQSDSAEAVEPPEGHAPSLMPAVGTVVPLPPLLAYVTIGINEVTRRLETQTKQLRTGKLRATLPSPMEPVPADGTNVDPSLSSSEPLADDQAPSKPLRLVLACRSDVDPPMLIAHLPMLVAAYNSLLPAESLKASGTLLATLPKQGEHAVAEALGLRRAALIGFDDDTPGLDGLLEHLGADVTPITASWLGDPKSVELVPTHVKQLRTSAPKDIRRAKEERVAGRAAAKVRKKEQKASLATKGKGKDKDSQLVQKDGPRKMRNKS